MTAPRPTPETIRAERAAAPTARERDFADGLGITEADLLAAHLGPHDGTTITRIQADPARILAALAPYPSIMGLTRNDIAILEITGHYRDGDGRVGIDITPDHWVHGFAMTRTVSGGLRRSLQIFDAAGEAVHKAFALEGSEAPGWDEMVAGLALPEQSDLFTPAAPPAGGMAGRDAAGAARELAPGAFERLMRGAAEAAVPVRLRVTNRGCAAEYEGPIVKTATYGPYWNVLDPGLEMHLRTDRLARIAQMPDGAVLGLDAAGATVIELAGTDAAGWAALLDAEPA
ncbi:ChuX/HutX family heme-like substrate-binding protein [Phaeovulum vinaykumarii]|uniref:Putative hemin transport protein n=1 Tax=Phaeovulum vinaykumarii TaxID=407234 RepID=A0A1N7LAQ6_9RHOB|nr:ChuX/HutX family heme-like substrate-binding protein [Phaeovulum vinaykumarii]SIS70869.1 putative hemin transport protein [Phaeovulum vinaykumarii]SOB98678.1 putative hemin transport protein [Phaeovulum vinaykumarii]